MHTSRPLLLVATAALAGTTGCGAQGGDSAAPPPSTPAAPAALPGARLVTVPQLVGRRQADAHRMLARAGLRMRWTGFAGKAANGRYNIGCIKVLRQSPVAGEHGPRGAGHRGHRGRLPHAPPVPAWRRGLEARTANLLGALAGVVADRTEAALLDATGLSRTEAAALITLDNYADGEPLGLLRDATGALPPGHRAAGRPTRAPRVRAAPRGRRRGRAGRRAGADARRPDRGRRRARGARADRPVGPRAAVGSRAARPDAALGPDAGRRDADARDSRVICDLCDGDACGHPRGCPVTQAALRAGGATARTPRRRAARPG